MAQRGRPKLYKTEDERVAARKLSMQKATTKYLSTKSGKHAQRRAMDNHINKWSGRVSKILASKRWYCKTNNLEFNLDAEWLLPRLKGRCEITNLEFKMVKAEYRKKKQSGPKPFSPSIDRIDPNKGYTKDNCRLIISCVNAFKSTMTDKQMKNVAKALLAGLS